MENIKEYLECVNLELLLKLVDIVDVAKKDYILQVKCRERYDVKTKLRDMWKGRTVEDDKSDFYYFIVGLEVQNDHPHDWEELTLAFSEGFTKHIIETGTEIYGVNLVLDAVTESAKIYDHCFMPMFISYTKKYGLIPRGDIKRLHEFYEKHSYLFEDTSIRR